MFLAAENMKDQLNLIGIGFGPTMHAAFKKRNENESIKHGIKIVSDLYDRRNCIAHQNDREHASARQKTIRKKTVEEACDNIVNIVEAIHSIAITNESSCK